MQSHFKSNRFVHVGVDVGGTFTDLVLVDKRRNRIFTGKLLTTASDPSVAMLEGIDRILKDADINISEVEGVVHGTTLVTNTVIERKGAKVGLLTTRGFRDVAEMGREIRYDLYDLFLEKPEPLVPRYLRREVDERVGPDGEILKPFDVDGFKVELQYLLDQNVEAIAICLLHAYRNPAHERLARDLIQAQCPHIPVTLSSDVAPEIREYERGNTAVVNAYVQPLMKDYLARLASELNQKGMQGSLAVMLSGGGITTVEHAQRQPVHLIESGPAAGATAACIYAGLTGEDNLISFDMGGTTAKMCLVENGVPEHANEFEAARVRRFKKGSGLMLKVPVIDLIEIGAGGGSMAWIDSMGLLKIGPESASSDPGPICYRRGGKVPTVTDADLLLGYLSPEFFLGGEMALDAADVRNAIKERIADPLHLSLEAATSGIHAIVNENMAAATRMYIAEKGRDPRKYSMIAFGGAGPVHAYGLAKLLKLRRLICPLGAGVMSALGLLAAPAAVDLVRSHLVRLDRVDWPQLRAQFHQMEVEAREQLLAAGVDPETIIFERRANMRHVGQGFEISVPLPEGELAEPMLKDVKDSFFRVYAELFDRQLREIPIEVLSWRLHARSRAPQIVLDFEGQKSNSGALIKGTRAVYFPETGYAPCRIYNRYALRSGDTFRGPAVVEERESTTVIGPDCNVTVDSYLNLIIDIEYVSDGQTEETENRKKLERV